MAFDLITVLTAARSLRRSCEARVADRDDMGAEHTARVALLDLARGLDIEVYPCRRSRWPRTAVMARNAQDAAEALAEAADGGFHLAGHVASLTIHFRALAIRLGCEVLVDEFQSDAATADVDHDDEAAQEAVEGAMEAAE